MAFASALFGIGALTITAVAAPAPIESTTHTQSASQTKTYVVIVAHNESFDGSRRPLRFADDDGVRFAELFEQQGANVRLLSVLDAPSQKLFPKWPQHTSAPKRETLLADLKETFTEIEHDISAGHEVRFYFIFTGHGDVSDDGVGFIHLLDGRFSRRDLFEQVIAKSPATVNHVIIDACQSYFMVASRGAQAVAMPDQGNLIRRLIQRESLAAYPNTGVVVSTSNASEVHEWGRIEAGIFSHEVRSAMSGAADANADGNIDYAELGAFLAAANAGLPNEKTRIQAFFKPPAQNTKTPFSQVGNSGISLSLPTELGGRFYLEDDRAIRFADFHKSMHAPLRIQMVSRPRYFLRSDEVEFPITLAMHGEVVSFDKLKQQPRESHEKGATQDAFADHLFELPFDANFVAGFEQVNAANTLSDSHTIPGPTTQVKLDAASPNLRPWGHGIMASAVVTAAGAGLMEYLARGNAARYQSAAGDNQTIMGYQSAAETQHTTALTLGSISMGALVTAAAIYGYDYFVEKNNR